MNSGGFKTRVHSRLVGLSKRSSRKALYEFLDAQCVAIPDDSEVLVVGAGGEIDKQIREHATRKSWRCASLDIDPARQPDVVGDIETFPGDSDRFAAVFLLEVLEHVAHPDRALGNVLRMLKPCGRLVLSTPFLFPVHDAPGDFRRFTRFGLELLLQPYSEIEITARNGYFEAVNVQIMRVLISERGRSLGALAIGAASIYLGRPVAVLLDRWMPLELGTTGYTAAAVKPVRERS